MSEYCAACGYRLDSYTHAEECEVGIVDSDDAAQKVLRLKARIAELEAVISDVALALETMGSERRENFGTPQVVRDLCRHQAARLRKVFGSPEPSSTTGETK